MRAIGNTVFTCEFCGQTFARYFRGEKRGAYKYCSRTCAMHARWAEKNARPFPSEKELLAFWNSPENRPFIERTIGGFLSRHSTVSPEEARSEAMLIVAKSLRNGRANYSIITDIKYGLLRYFKNTYLWSKSLGMYSLDNPDEWRDEIGGLVNVEQIISQMSAEVDDARKSTDFNSLMQQINESELLCMRVLAARLRGDTTEDIIHRFELKKKRSVNDYIHSAMVMLGKRKGKSIHTKPMTRCELNKDEIIKYRAEGLTCKAIAKIYDVGEHNVSYFLRKLKNETGN